ncbi:MAG: cupin domain-containing protein [Bacteroidales bacterium]|nr:cupin domain-containing protein [Bacteroidales bacterium]
MKNMVNLFDELNWENTDNYPEGTLKKTLRNEQGAKTILLKLPKGFKMGSHSHVTTEQHLVLKGAYSSEGKTYSEGSYQLIPAHENHGPFESRNGALILIIWDPFIAAK